MSPTPAPNLWTTIEPLTGDGIATVAAALIAALIAVATYRWQQQRARRDRQAQIYGKAIQAVKDYAEAPTASDATTEQPRPAPHSSHI